MHGVPKGVYASKTVATNANPLCINSANRVLRWLTSNPNTERLNVESDLRCS